MTNLIPETDRTIVFDPSGEPYIHMLSMLDDLTGRVMCADLNDRVSADYVQGMKSVVGLLLKHYEILTLEHQVRQS